MRLICADLRSVTQILRAFAGRLPNQSRNRCVDVPARVGTAAAER
jgi:hypothetical protein